MLPGFSYQKAAKQVLATEIEGLQQLDQYFNDDFTRACDLILNNSGGKVIVMGMGKSGHIGRKIAATFASTGTSAFLFIPAKLHMATLA